MKRRIIFLTTIVLAFAIAFTTAIKDHSGKFHVAGLPINGETTCSAPACHGAGNGSFTSGGLSDNGGPGNIALTSSNMPGWIYTPGTTYHMTITITDPGVPLFGFSAAVMDNGGNNAGNIIVTDAAHTRTGIVNSIVYITHVGGPTGPNPGYQTITANPAVINFDWTAPASNVGSVTFYFDGVAANNNGWEDAADNVYTGTQIATPNSATSLLLRAPATVPAFSSSIGVATLPQPITVGGTGLLGSVTVTMPTDFQVSSSSTSGFGSSIILASVSGTLATTTLYVRYLPSTASASGNIVISNVNASNASIAISGSTTATPSVFVDFTLINTSWRTVVGYPSIVKKFNVSGINLTGNMNIGPFANYEVSLSSGSGFAGSLSIAPTSGSIAATTVYVRYNPAAAGLHNGLLPIASTGATTKYVTVGGLSVVPPVITPSGTLNAFNTTVGTPSANQTFSISGSSLKWDIVITAPANFEVSLSSGSGYVNSVTLTQSSGSVSSTTIHVRYNPISAGSHSGNIVMSSVGDPTTATLAVNGTSTNPVSPTIATNNPPSAFSTIVGTPSVEQISTISGLNLTTNLVVTAPTNFEVSLTSGSGFGSSVSLIPVLGSVNSTSLYIRYNPASAGTTNSTISLTSTGATTQHIAVSGTSTIATAVVNALISNASLSIYPNPVNGSGYISFNLSASDQVRVNLLNYQGQYIKELYSNSVGSGDVQIPFDFTGLTKGVYLIEIQAGNSSVRKLLIAE